MTSGLDRTGRTRRRIGGRGERAGARLVLIAPLLVLLLLAACSESPATPTAAPPQDEAVTPTDPAVTPLAARASVPGQVGGRLLFARAGNIWVWADGQATQLTTDGGYRQPRWSPDGAQMLYVRVGNSFSDLWLADATGANGRALTVDQAKGFQVESEEYVKNSSVVAGASWARLSTGANRVVFSRSAYDTNRLRSYYSLWVLNDLAKPAVPIYGTQSLTENIEGVALSPDGNSVAFVYDLTDPKTGVHTTQIYVVDLVSGTYRALTSEANGAYDPAWSPDGNWLVYAARQGNGDTNLMVIRADGTGRRRLTDSGKDRGATWSPDGDQIAFTRQQGNGFGLYFIDLDTSSGSINPSKPQRIGDFADVDPASGVSWAREAAP